MVVPYDLFCSAFLSKIHEFEFMQLYEYERTNIVDGYMKRAISKFKPVCRYNIDNYNDSERIINVEIPDDELDEIIDIVSEGMLEQWMKPYVYCQENLENIVNTRDFSIHSPSELLFRIGNEYRQTKQNYTNMIREYSYSHADLSALHL